MSRQEGEPKHQTEGCEKKKIIDDYDHDRWTDYCHYLYFDKKAQLVFLKEAISYHQLRGKYPHDDESAMEDFLENFLGADLSAEDYFCADDVVHLVEENFRYNYREMKKECVDGGKDEWNEDEVKFYELTSQIWGNDDCWWLTYSDCLSCDKKEQIHFFKEVIAYHQLNGIDPLANMLDLEEFLLTCLRVDSCSDTVMILVEERFKREYIEMKEEDKNGEKNKWDEDKVKWYELTTQIWGKDDI